MNEIPPLGSSSSLLLAFPGRSLQGGASSPAATDAVDSLELSDIAQVLGRLPVSTPIRTEKVARIREAIQNGTYETPERIDATVDRLMEALNL